VRRVDENELRAAADAGDADAMVKLADHLNEKHVYDEDTHEEEVQELLERAAELGHREAPYALGVLLRAWGNPEEAEPWLRRAADAGDAEAWAELGHLYDGEDDPEQAVRCYRRAAELGSRQGAENLALLEADAR
jgi:TPR repeat protein